MIKYYRLFDLLNRRNMKKTDLLTVISAPTLAKLGKGDIVKTDIIDKICSFLECQPEDIMEHIVSETSINDEITLVSKKENVKVGYDNIIQANTKEYISKNEDGSKEVLGKTRKYDV